jgi:rubrerythrin
MKEMTTFDSILDFAIEEEQKAVEFYSELALMASSDEMREVFEEFAQEEVKHKAKLMYVKETGITNMPPENVADLKIADYIINVKASPNMSYQEALVVAMNKEKAAFRLYTSLSKRAEDPVLIELFAGLAQEESKHKLRFEVEYDDYVLREN